MAPNLQLKGKGDIQAATEQATTMEVDCSSFRRSRKQNCPSDRTLNFFAVITSLSLYFIAFIMFGDLFLAIPA